MERRAAIRYKRRVQLDFWSRGDRNPRKGFTQNLSVKGLFVSTNAPFKPGTRIFIEVPSGSEKLLLQGEVRYSARVDPLLQKVKPSGMGVRLLGIDELMAELLRIKISSNERAAKPISTGDEVGDSEATDSGDRSVFQVSFDSARDLLTSYERDLKYGGLFVPATHPAAKDEEIVIDFRFGWDESASVRVEAVVVKEFTSAEGSIAGESVAGMGVAFSDPKEALRQFDSVLSKLDANGG